MEQEEKDKKKEEFKELIANKFAIEKEERALKMLNHWNNLSTLINAEDVPFLPRVDKVEWQEFYVPRLIKAGAIPKEKLVDGVWYYGEYRNSNYGKWNANKQKFGLWRHKFGWMWDDCNHFQDDDGFALFVPLRIANDEEIEKQNQIEIERNIKK